MYFLLKKNAQVLYIKYFKQHVSMMDIYGYIQSNLGMYFNYIYVIHMLDYLLWKIMHMKFQAKCNKTYIYIYIDIKLNDGGA